MHTTPEERAILACLERMNARNPLQRRRVPGWVRVALLGAGLSLTACRSPGPDADAGVADNAGNVNDKDIPNHVEDDYNHCDYSASFEDSPDYYEYK